MRLVNYWRDNWLSYSVGVSVNNGVNVKSWLAPIINVVIEDRRSFCSEWSRHEVSVYHSKHALPLHGTSVWQAEQHQYSLKGRKRWVCYAVQPITSFCTTCYSIHHLTTIPVLHYNSYTPPHIYYTTTLPHQYSTPPHYITSTSPITSWAPNFECPHFSLFSPNYLFYLWAFAWRHCGCWGVEEAVMTGNEGRTGLPLTWLLIPGVPLTVKYFPLLFQSEQSVADMWKVMKR